MHSETLERGHMTPLIAIFSVFWFASAAFTAACVVPLTPAARAAVPNRWRRNNERNATMMGQFLTSLRVISYAHTSAYPKSSRTTRGLPS